jgi:hypothetical protein
MFGLFKSKKKPVKQQDFAANIAEELFQQIKQSRDEAKAGGIVDEKVFNDRLNAMYAAGYLLGYVDTHISDLTDDDTAKKQYAESVFEAMFPGVGTDFIKEKLAVRKKAPQLSAEDSNYAETAEQCNAFDTGMNDAEEEVEAIRDKPDYQPQKLKEFLLLGE